MPLSNFLTYASYDCTAIAAGTTFTPEAATGAAKGAIALNNAIAFSGEEFKPIGTIFTRAAASVAVAAVVAVVAVVIVTVPATAAAPAAAAAAASTAVVAAPRPPTSIVARNAPELVTTTAAIRCRWPAFPRPLAPHMSRAYMHMRIITFVSAACCRAALRRLTSHLFSLGDATTTTVCHSVESMMGPDPNKPLGSQSCLEPNLRAVAFGAGYPARVDVFLDDAERAISAVEMTLPQTDERFATILRFVSQRVSMNIERQV